MAGELVARNHPGRTRDSSLLVDTGHAALDGQYANATGMDISSADYAPVAPDGSAVPMHALLCCDTSGGGDAAGDIAVELGGGGIMIIPVTTPAGYHQPILRGCVIAKVLKSASGTTYTGLIFPLW